MSVGGNGSVAAQAERLAEALLPLAGVRVLDLADASGSSCGRILADLGADVVKVEPPGGDPSRREPPFADDRDEPDRSLTWLAENVNKRGITCNLALAEGRELFLRLASRTDVVIDTFRRSERTALGLEYEALARRNPGLILTCVTPFGLEGPRADDPGSDLEIWAASGSLWLSGEPARPPVRSSLPQTPHWSGMYAATGALLALFARAESGKGQVVDVSAQASMITAISHAPVFWDLLGEEQVRSGAYLTGRSVTGANFRNLWPCKDGYVTFALYGGAAGRHTNKQLIAWMAECGEVPEVLRRVDWDTFDVNTVQPSTLAELEPAIAPFVLGLTKQEFFENVVRRNMLGYSVATPEDIKRDEQLAARGFWEPVAAPWGTGPIPFPGSFAVFDGRRAPIRRTAPRLGEHNLEVYTEELGLSADEINALAARGVL